MESLREPLGGASVGTGGRIGMVALLDGVGPNFEAAPFSDGNAASEDLELLSKVPSLL